jgi:hypothetical protein
MTIFIRCKFALQATKLVVAFNGAVCGFKYMMNGAKKFKDVTKQILHEIYLHIDSNIFIV